TPARRVAIPVERYRIRRDHHAFDVEVVVETFAAEFAPDPGIVNAAPGRSRIESVVIVDPDDAGFDAGGEAMGPCDVVGADCRRKPERRVIGEPQRLSLV